MASSKTLGKDQATDVHIAAGLALHALLDDKGMQSIGQLLQGAKDHVQALAHGIFMIMSQVRSQLQQRGIDIDSRVWVASGGVLDQVIGNLGAVVAGVFGMDEAASPEFAQAVKKAVVDLMQHEDDNQQAPGDDEESEPMPDDEGAEGEMPQRGLLSAGGMG